MSINQFHVSAEKVNNISQFLSEFVLHVYLRKIFFFRFLFSALQTIPIIAKLTVTEHKLLKKLNCEKKINIFSSMDLKSRV